MFVKICGITTEKDALLAIALGADALGFVFAPGSPRMVTVDEATDIVKHVPYDEVLTLGVFRDERPERVAEIVNRVGLKGAQLHGRESAAEVVYVRQRVPLVVQGFAAGDPAISMASEGPADVVLLDAPDPDPVVRAMGEPKWEGTLPATFVFDEKGKLRRSFVGRADPAALEAAIRAITR